MTTLWSFETKSNRGRPAGKRLRTRDGVKVTKFGTAVDSQRTKMYNWELKYVDSTPAATRQLTHAEIIALVTEICAAHGIPAPKIRFSGTATSGYTHNKFDDTRSVIRFCPGLGSAHSTVLHETAHRLQDALYAPSIDAGHSPTFMRIYIDLLTIYLGFDPVMLLKTAKEARLKVAEPIPYLIAAGHKKRFPVKLTQTVLAAPKRGRGRPKGSKNKPK